MWTVLLLPVGALASLFAQVAPPVAAAPAPLPAGPLPPAAATQPPSSERPRIRAVRTPQAPVIDGKLDDAAWSRAVASDTFTQHFPDEGAPPSERTSVRILYDDDALYVGVDCPQVHSPVVKRLMRRDTQLPSDGVWLDIDSRRDGVSAFHFSINAAGVLGDAIHFNDLEYSAAWDAVWEGRAADTPSGYSVEFRIPLYVLRFEALPIQDWGFELRRFIEARQETDDWAFLPRSAGSYIPMFGRIDDLAELRPRRWLQLRPFVLGRLRHRAPAVAASAETLTHGFDAQVSAGLDAKISVTNEMALDLTLNPDFGQVEADTVVLNLSTFETFFPEKRPFFLEGIDTFATPRSLVYTRRIGHQPPAPILSGAEKLVDSPEPTVIYGAAKLVGTIGGRTTVGVLSAITGRNEVFVRTPAPSSLTSPRTVEPPTSYNVLRLKRLVGDHLQLGALAAATNRFEPSFASTNDAYVISADGRWRSRGGDYAVTGQALASALVNGPPRPQSDGIAILPGQLAPGGSLSIDKLGGTRWLWSVYQQLSGRMLELNDLGYLDRKNDYQAAVSVTYRTIEPWWKTLETRTVWRAEGRRTLDGIDLVRSTSLTSWWLLSGFWAVQLSLTARAAAFDDREMGDGTALERAGRWGGSLAFSGDPRRRVLWTLSGQALRIADGRHFDASGTLTLRALPQLELDLIPAVTYDEGEPRYVATTAPLAYLLGTQQARSVGATLRAAYTFTPELSLQVYGQAFLARVHYTRFFAAAVAEQRERVTLSALVPTSPAAPEVYDSITSSLNLNVVLRWEYLLGSTVFLVYTRAQTPVLIPTASGATSLELRPILQGRAAVDVIMLKLAYWWG